MKRFNQMTENQMSQIDGGFAVGVLLAIVLGGIAAAAGVVGASVGIVNGAKTK